MFNVPPPHNGTDGADNTMKRMKQAGRSSFLTKSNHAQPARILCRTIELTHCRRQTHSCTHCYQNRTPSNNMTNSFSLARLSIVIACFLTGASTFQIESCSRRPHITATSSSQLPHTPTPSRLYATPLTDFQAAADTESSVSTTEFILSEISTNDVRKFQVIHVVS